MINAGAVSLLLRELHQSGDSADVVTRELRLLHALLFWQCVQSGYIVHLFLDLQLFYLLEQDLQIFRQPAYRPPAIGADAPFADFDRKQNLP